VLALFNSASWVLPEYQYEFLCVEAWGKRWHNGLLEESLACLEDSARAEVGSLSHSPGGPLCI
jgi:hypothetical protein